MAETRSIDPEMDMILSNPPRRIGNSVIIKVLRYVILALGLILFPAGVGLLISSIMQNKIVDVVFIDTVFQYEGSNAAQIERISQLVGVGLIVLGLLLLLISRLINSIFKRNTLITAVCLRWKEIKNS